MTSIGWIRRGLRLTDNFALHAALEAASFILTFILDPAFSYSSPRRKNFLYEGLAHTNNAQIITTQLYYFRIFGVELHQ